MQITGLEFPSLFISLIANIALVIIVFLFAPKNNSRIYFTLFGVSQAIWLFVNYISVQAAPEETLNMARWAILSAIPHPPLLFLFLYSFSNTKKILNSKKTFLLIGLIVSMMLLARSPWLFTHTIIENDSYTPIPGPGMAVFAFYTFLFVFSGFIVLFKRWKNSNGRERNQWKLIGIGLLTTFFLVLVFNFIFVIVFNKTEFVNFGHFYTLPFVIFTSYAMIKHKFLNLKTIVAQVSVVLLVLIVFVQLLNADSVSQFLVGVFVLLGTIIVGSLLIKGVLKEIEQREQLERLSKELYSANQRLKELDNLKTEFLSITSHQLRTPLSGIKGYLSMMIDGDFGKFSDEQGTILNRVKSEVDRLVRLVQDFLNVSRIESGRLQIAKLDFDLVDVIKTVIQELTPTAENAKLNLSHKLEANSLSVVGDPDKIKDVVVNLVDNAIKYTQAGKIWVEAKLVDNNTFAQVEVHDTGVGVDEKEIHKLFSKFQRAKGIAKVSPSGSGLGLFIAKKIIAGHGGDIWAESKGKGKGSAFIFKIPLKNNSNA